MKKAKLCGSLRRCIKGRAVLAAAAGAVLALGVPAMGAAQCFNWDPTLTGTATGGGSGTTAGHQWDASSVDWFNPTTNADVVWDSADATTAVFGGTFTGTATVNIVSPTTPGANTLSAAGLTFNSTGYTLSSSTANNTLYLTSPGGSAAPTISVGAGLTDTIGAFVSGGAGPNNLTLGGTAGLNVSGGGTLVLGNAITLSGGITVTGSTLAEGIPALGAGNTTFSYLNNNDLTLNNGSFTVNSTNSPFSTGQLIGNVTMSGNSTITMSRGNSAASSSILFNGSLIVQPNAVVNFSMAGNTSTNGALIQFGSTILNGPATFVDYENATQNAGGATAGAPFGENGRLGFYSDGGFAATFLSGGSSTLAGTSIRINSSIGQGSNATGNWTLGSSNTTTPQGVALDLDTASGNTGGITSGTIMVNPWSQLWLDGTGIITWGSSAQTITISGIGTVTPANAPTAVYTNGNTQPGGGALALTNPTTGQLGNTLDSNVFMAAASSISVGTNTINEIDGNITGTGPVTIVGSGTLNLGGTANDWSGGTIINNGSIVVNSGSSLGSSAGQTGPLTLASSGTTNPTSTNLTLNVNQTVQTLSASFAAATGMASNSIVLNGVNLNIVQKANGTFGPGASPTLSSFIADGSVAGGKISLDAASTGTLTFSGANTYTGGTTINGGALIVSNPAGSATGTGPVVVNSGTSLAGDGKIAGTVTLNGATLLPGANVGGAHLAGPLTLGGLSLNGGILDYNLNTPGSSDEIALGNSGDLNLGAAGNPVTINLINLGALDSGTYPLITYSSSAGSETGSFNNLVNGLALGSKPNGFTFALHDDPDAVDLVVTAPASLTWSGGSGTWDTVSQNWNNNTQMFSNTGPSNNSVIFDDGTPGTAPFTVTVAAGGVTPGLVTFANNSTNYTVVSSATGGAEISGNSTMVISGSGMVTLSGPNSFTGVVAVDGGGTLNIDSDGELGNATNSVLLTSASTAHLSTLRVTNNVTTTRGISLFGVGGAIDVTGGKYADAERRIGGVGRTCQG